ncbi:MAG TPA: TetR/AcrR family transcriptional regulator [Bacteroidales bacterium]|nr:TetR/AcrR family transcriptional regulator [Bacteroidales bacterium]
MSPRTPQQFEEIREEKKALIMNVALEHFAREGYHNTTISHIARHAGISKGLMYNYFNSKDELLSEIINRSLDEISKYFDPDKDGYLTEEEFDLFIRKLFYILREKLHFWRLFYQFLMQKDVRDKFLKTHLGLVKSVEAIYSNNNSPFLSSMTRILTEYFQRKRERKPKGYDPVLDLNLFIYTVEGFGMVTVYMDEVDEMYYNKTIDRIIELYK